ncbi:hypothetical protein QAD02_003016 [Eretmocerus hayati]|uniref:Uncharacterized protein n=1 Tax=Eretmocerus hayati TaxID=131215 RepID=A0ACC2NNF3_9HYME|nr:hypothetical protein QAD02_003016 [Eretmocerus hayati]
MHALQLFHGSQRGTKTGKTKSTKEEGDSWKYLIRDEPAKARTRTETVKTMHKVAMRIHEGGPEAETLIDGVKKPSMLLTLLRFNIISGCVPILGTFPVFSEYAERWTLLVTVLPILLQREITRAEIERDDTLLREFVTKTEWLYDRQIAKTIKKVLDTRYFGYKKRTPLQWIKSSKLSENCWVYGKMVRNRCLYNSARQSRSRRNNSFAITKDGKYVRLLDSIVDESSFKEVTICNYVTTEEAGGQPSQKMQKLVSISPVPNAIDTVVIDQVCIVINVGNKSHICEVPHLYHY